MLANPLKDMFLDVSGQGVDGDESVRILRCAAAEAVDDRGREDAVPPLVVVIRVITGARRRKNDLAVNSRESVRNCGDRARIVLTRSLITRKTLAAGVDEDQRPLHAGFGDDVANARGR